VLDVGCGRGEFCAFFAGLGHETLGLDISEPVIDFARRQHPQLEFRAGEVQTLLPELAGSFDVVFSSEVIEHLFDVGRYLDAIHALLRPQGRFVLTTPYHGLVKNILIDLFNYSGHYDPLGQHIRFFDRKGLSEALRRHGFEPVAWAGYGRPWPLWKSFFVVAEKRRNGP
jgi:SAM-dependent methyltransferase